MTEFCEAVAYAIYCVGQEGLHTSLKPEDALIYPTMVVSSSWKHHGLDTAYRYVSTKLRHPNHHRGR